MYLIKLERIIVMSVKKLALAGIFVAIGVVCSAFYIPVGVSKVFPIQHFINVLAGGLLGPAYAVCMAFVTSLIRVLSGTGTLLAFPGSMCGAFLCSIIYKYTKNIYITVVGEVIGTGIIGALIAYPVATLLLSRQVALFTFILPFSLSSFVGAILSGILLIAIKKTGVLKKLELE